MCLYDESNPFIGGGIGKPTWSQDVALPRSRAAVFKRGESYGHDPKPGDLRVGKVKHGESYVEAC